MPSTPIQIYCIYATADEPMRQALEKHVSAMMREGLIMLVHDQQVAPGRDRIQAMDAHLDSSKVFLLLISPDFIASDACYETALQRALERHHRGEARVVPILVRPVDYQGTPFTRLMVLPTSSLAVTQWSNQDEAWLDVASALRTLIESGTLPPQARLPQAAPIWNVPFPRNPFFTGRDELLTQLEQALQQAPRAALSQPQAVSGLGGIGKTQMALEFAHRHRDDYKAILWCRAETREDLIAGYVAIAELLQLPVKYEKEQMVVVQAVIHWLQTHEHWLLILDNADELSFVQESLPTGGLGHVLLTTRASSMGRLAQCLEVETMTMDTGAVFVLHRAGLLALDASLEQAPIHDIELARELVQEMGGLPLALDQAGAYMEETDLRLADYLSLYRSQRTALLKERGGIVQDHPEAVATTWSLSFTKVERASPVAADLLRACAFLQPDAIPEEIFIEGAEELSDHLQILKSNPLAFNAAIKVLRSYSLIQRDPQEHFLSVHRLVQAVLIERMTQKTQRQWVQQAVCAVNRVFPITIDEIATWPQCQRCLPQAQVCAALITHSNITVPQAAHLLNRAGHYLHMHAQYEQAKLLYQCALTICERVLLPEHSDTALTLHHLAWLYRDQQQYEQAEPLYLRALAIREQSGPQHPSTASTLNHLATLYQNQGQYERAEPLYLRALAIKEKQLGSEHPSTANTLHNLATLYQDLGQYQRAEPLYLRALAIREQATPQHPYAAGTLHRLATLYEAQSKYEQAEALYLRALSLYEQQLGPEHHDTAETMHDLARLRQATRQQ